MIRGLIETYIQVLTYLYWNSLLRCIISWRTKENMILNCQLYVYYWSSSAKRFQCGKSDFLRKRNEPEKPSNMKNRHKWKTPPTWNRSFSGKGNFAEKWKKNSKVLPPMKKDEPEKQIHFFQTWKTVFKYEKPNFSGKGLFSRKVFLRVSLFLSIWDIKTGSKACYNSSQP